MTHLSEHEDDGPVVLADLATELVAGLAGHDAGRTARTVLTGPAMRATVIALAEGAGLSEHDAPPAATLQVLVGQVRLVTGDQQQALSAGDLVPIPPVRHALEADTDAAVLLTVALGGGAAGEHH